MRMGASWTPHDLPLLRPHGVPPGAMAQQQDEEFTDLNEILKARCYASVRACIYMVPCVVRMRELHVRRGVLQRCLVGLLLVSVTQRCSFPCVLAGMVAAGGAARWALLHTAGTARPVAAAPARRRARGAAGVPASIKSRCAWGWG